MSLPIPEPFPPVEPSMEWQPLKTKLVVEVSYDHFTGGPLPPWHAPAALASG